MRYLPAMQKNLKSIATISSIFFMMLLWWRLRRNGRARYSSLHLFPPPQPAFFLQSPFCSFLFLFFLLLLFAFYKMLTIHLAGGYQVMHSFWALLGTCFLSAWDLFPLTEERSHFVFLLSSYYAGTVLHPCVGLCKIAMTYHHYCSHLFASSTLNLHCGLSPVSIYDQCHYVCYGLCLFLMEIS